MSSGELGGQGQAAYGDFRLESRTLANVHIY
jgi:hypothetical protein